MMTSRIGEGWWRTYSCSRIWMMHSLLGSLRPWQQRHGPRFSKRSRAPLTSVSRDQLVLRHRKDAAQEAWDMLENVYTGKAVSNKLFLKDELFRLWLGGGDDIEDHVCRFQNYIVNLEKVAETYKDHDMAIILLRSLPSSFKDFRTLMFGKYSLKLEDVIQAFQSYAILDDITESSQVPYAKGKERE